MDRWTLHGPARFLRDVLDAFERGANVLIAAPLDAAPDLLPRLEERVAETHRTVVMSASGLDPLQSIYEALELPPGVVMSRSVASLLAVLGDKRIVFVEIRELQQWLAWRQFLETYESGCRAVSKGKRTLFIVRVSGVPWRHITSAAPALEVLAWTGQISESDIRSYAFEKLRLKEGRVDRRVKLIGRIIHELGAWDLDLVDRLIDLPWYTLFAPHDALASVVAAGAKPPVGASWESGGTCAVDGEEIQHALWLLASQDPDRELTRRLWAAQAAELLPLLEIKRRHLASRIRAFGKVPPTDVINGEPVGDLSEVELGGLKHLSYKHRLPKSIQRSARTLSDYRNKLAHLEPLNADEVLAFLES